MSDEYVVTLGDEEVYVTCAKCGRTMRVVTRWEDSDVDIDDIAGDQYQFHISDGCGDPLLVGLVEVHGERALAEKIFSLE